MHVDVFIDHKSIQYVYIKRVESLTKDVVRALKELRHECRLLPRESKCCCGCLVSNDYG